MSDPVDSSARRPPVSAEERESGGVERVAIEHWSEVVDEATRAIWPSVAAAAPDSGMLMGGTALAIHLRHRRSRDLDVFVHAPFDPTEVLERLTHSAAVAVTAISEGTLNCSVEGVSVQFLLARGQTPVAATLSIDGLSVASLQDVAATKLKVIGDRGELRDYYDLMRIETDAGLMVETGLRLYTQRYGVGIDHPSVAHIVRALGSFTDVAADPWLADAAYDADRADASLEAVSAYWTRRQPETADWLTKHLT